jgi:FkbM family methyltransferase
MLPRVLQRLVTLPGVSHLIDIVRALPLPVPLRLFDGVRRIGTPRLWLLVGVWRRLPTLRDESQRVYDAYAGGDVIDVGAFQGWYSALLAPKARPGDRLVSCEPDPGAYRDLLANLGTLSAMFPQLRLWAIPEPVGDGSPVAVTDPSHHHPSFRAGGDGVPSTTVDRLVEAAGLRPSFVKIDVEGAEWHVLAGMRHTLETFKPTLMLELHPGWQPPGIESEDVTGVLADLGYTWVEIGAGDHFTKHLLCRPAA